MSLNDVLEESKDGWNQSRKDEARARVSALSDRRRWQMGFGCETMMDATIVNATKT